MPVIDPSKVPVKTGSIYPEPYADMMRGRSSLRLGDAGGLTQFGVNLVTLEPGALSSLRHWHLNEDEFVMVTGGECTLVQDAGETVMGPGDCAAFPAGSTDGHHFINRSDRPARFLVVGSKAPREVATYSDVDLRVEIEGGKARFTYKDGSDFKGVR
ncbi:MAG: cupin domain-containing protein [Paracoccaceae bacterium]|nr:cupin domain-containing protein [Paracoccaceae bacterium]